MSEERTLFKNISFMALSMIIPNIFNLVLLMIVARILLNPGMNDYNVVISYVTMFAILSDVGTAGVLVRDVVRDRSKASKYFGTFFTIRSGIIIFMVSLSLIIAGYMPYEPHIIQYIYIAAISQLLFQISQIFTSLFQAHEKMEYIAYGTILQAVTLLVLGYAFVEPGIWNMGVLGLIYANIIANFLMLAFYVVVTKRNMSGIKLGFDREIGKYLIIAGLPFGIAGILSILYSYLDRIMLSIIRYSEVANYTMPYTLVMSLSFILLAYASSVFPMFSKVSVRKNSPLKYACEKSFKYLFAIIIPMCVGITLLSDRIIYTIYGEDFSGAIPVLSILIWILSFMVITNIGSPLLTSTHRERIPMYSIFICSVANIVLNLLLIPDYGAVGASIASLLTIGVLNGAITLLFIREDIKGIDLIRPLINVAVASAVMTVSILMIDLNNLILYIIMGAIVYLITYLLIGGVTKDDIELLRRIFKVGDGRFDTFLKIAGKFIRNY